DTVGSSLLLTRPCLRANNSCVRGDLVFFFFFFIPTGGVSLPLVGAPPLFLGYLSGVPFWWVPSHSWPVWLTGVGILLAMFYVVDARNYARAPKPVREHLTEHEQIRFQGLLNLALLGVIFASVFITHPFLLREAIMVTAAIASYFATNKNIHDANHFSFAPLQEVAILFVGIFATMMPALDWLIIHAAKLEKLTPEMLYFG